MTAPQLAQLRTWNIWLTVLFAGQAVVLLTLSVSHALPMALGFVGVDTLASQGHEQVLAAGTHHLFDVNIAFLVAAFLATSAIAYGLMATKLQPYFEKDAKKGANTIRWVGHAVSASLMLVTVAILCGMYDVVSLLMLGSLTVVMSLVGMAAERRAQQNESLLVCAAGAVAGIMPWLVVGVYVLGSWLYGTLQGYMAGIFVSMVVLFALFATNTFLRYRKHRQWASYWQSERVYMALALVTQTALAWQIFAGVLHP